MPSFKIVKSWFKGAKSNYFILALQPFSNSSSSLPIPIVPGSTGSPGTTTPVPFRFRQFLIQHIQLVKRSQRPLVLSSAFCFSLLFSRVSRSAFAPSPPARQPSQHSCQEQVHNAPNDIKQPREMVDMAECKAILLMTGIIAFQQRLSGL